MPMTRSLVLDAMRSLLADNTHGLNAQLAATREAYGIDEPVWFDWSADAAHSVFYGGVSDQAARRTRLAERATLRMSTGSSVWTGETRNVKWSGVIEGRLQFLVRMSHEDREEDSIEDYDIIEQYIGWIEDAVTEVFARRDIDWGDLGVIYARPPDCPEPPDAVLYADGWEQAIPMRLGFRVDANYES